MDLTRSLQRNSVLFFSGFVLLVVWGFWSTYFSNPLQVPNALVHLHGLAMTVWCALIVAQAYLIRTNKRDAHRLVGRASYAIAPMVFVLMIAVALGAIRRGREGLVLDGTITDFGYFVMSLGLVGAVIFASLYTLAIRFRRNTAVHARLMLCTVFPIATAAVDRILDVYFPAFKAHLPVIAGGPNTQLVTWGSADVMLLGLSIWDWRSHRRGNVFPPVLATLLAYHVFTANAHRIGAWRSFIDWATGF
jgi:hypothetical protein